MSSSANPIAFRLGRGSLFWGKHSFLFFRVGKNVRLNYLIIKLLIFVLKQERFFIVDFLFNFNSFSKFFLLLILYKAFKHKKRYEKKRLKVHKFFIRLNRIIRFKLKNRKVKKRFIKKIKFDHRFLIYGRRFYIEFEEFNHKKIKQLLIQEQKTAKSLFPVINFFKKKTQIKKSKIFSLRNYFKIKNLIKEMYKAVFCLRANTRFYKKKNYLGNKVLSILLYKKIFRYFKNFSFYYTFFKKYVDIPFYKREIYINFGKKTTFILDNYDWNKTLKSFFYKIFLLKNKDIKFRSLFFKKINKSCPKNKLKKYKYFFNKKSLILKTFLLKKNINKRFSLIKSLLTSIFLVSRFKFKKNTNISFLEKNNLHTLFFLNLVLFNKKYLRIKNLFKKIKLYRNFFGRKKRLLFFEFFLQKIIKIPICLKVLKVGEIISETRNFLVDKDVEYIYKRCFIPRKAFIFCKNFIHLLTYSIIFFNLIGLSTFFISEFYYRKRQNFFLITVEKILRFMFFKVLYFSGFCLLILGKLARRKPRARSIFFFKKKVPQLSSIKLKVQYVYKQCISSFGAYGVKMWLYHY